MIPCFCDWHDAYKYLVSSIGIDEHCMTTDETNFNPVLILFSFLNLLLMLLICKYNGELIVLQSEKMLDNFKTVHRIAKGVLGSRCLRGR